MEILKSIVDSIHGNSPVTEVMRGLHWTAVVSRRCGLASAMPHGVCHNEKEDAGTGSLTDMTALELAGRCFSDEASEASLGFAAINSLLEINTGKCSGSEGLQLIGEMAQDKNISVIGHFPLLEELRKTAKNLWIIEKQPRPGDVPEENSPDYLPRSDIVVISSTTLINHTLPGILGLCKKGSLKMLLGPSTPMTEVLFDYGIDILSGSIITDKERILKSIAEGANFRSIKKTGAVRFVTMTKGRR